MSNTFKTNNARIARQLASKAVDSFNGKIEGDYNQIRIEAKVLETDGVRYGNHRKMKAKEKVTERKLERKQLNLEAKDEIVKGVDEVIPVNKMKP